MKGRAAPEGSRAASAAACAIASGTLRRNTTRCDAHRDSPRVRGVADVVGLGGNGLSWILMWREVVGGELGWAHAGDCAYDEVQVSRKRNVPKD